MFNNIIGNEDKKDILTNIINNKNISHSYMFIGQKGIGKFLFAKEFAKAILCLEENKPCNKCTSCIKFENNNNPDLIIIDVQEEKSIKTEAIKNLVKGLLEKPIQSNKKVYIINDSEKMTKEAQNSLLKTLEEPPEYTVIILITSNETALLNTIRSRCTKIQFNNLKKSEIINILGKPCTDTIIQACNGSIEKAVELQSKEELYIEIEKTFSKLNKLNIIDLMKLKEGIFKDKDIIQQVLDYINIILYNCNNINCMEIVQNTKDRLRKNCNYDMTIDNFLLKIWEEVNG